MYRFDLTALLSSSESDHFANHQIASPTEWTTTCADKEPIEEGSVYEIEEIIKAASAFVCIAHVEGNREQRLVFKVLREYIDERYHYASQKDRLMCQKEALRKNLTITPEIYQGLARISQSTLQEFEKMKHTGKLHSVKLGTIVQESDHVAPNCEHALVMSYLPDEQRLDFLLREEDPEKQKKLLHLLATRIEHMHESFRPPDTAADKDGDIWGSYEQLFKKLRHNLKHFDLIEHYEPELYKQHYHLKAVLHDFIKRERLQDAFKQRISEYVKQCHGDLKTNNIWIEAIKQADNSLPYVYILDAVDFNESYRNIDVLADLAMLVVDVEAVGGEEPGAYLVNEYLSLTRQTGDAAQLTLTYYLLEKAIVCAIVCIVYDHCESHMGQRFLDLAQKHADALEFLLNPSVEERRS